MDLQPEDIIDTIISRAHQSLNEGRKGNKVLFLPNASEKIYLITMIIKQIGCFLDNPPGIRKKWTFYIVETESCITEELVNLRNHLAWIITTFPNNINMNDLFSSQEEWKRIFNGCNIMVMTASLFLANLQNGLMDLNDAHLIIFDECHNALSLHPFNQIMEEFHRNGDEQKERPIILGITTTLVNTNTDDVKEYLTELQKTFNATIISSYKRQITNFSVYPREFIQYYDGFIPNTNLVSIINKIQSTNKNLKFILKSQMMGLIQTNINLELRNRFMNLENYFQDLENEILDGGAYTAFILSWLYSVEIEELKVLLNSSDKFQLNLVLSEMTIIRHLLFISMQENSRQNNCNGLCTNISSKLRLLLNILINIKRTDMCLILVNHQTTAKILYHYINAFIEENNNTNIVCNFLTGTKTLRNLRPKEVIFKQFLNDDIRNSFNERRINVVITTDVFKYDINIEDCNFVIRYDIPDDFSTYMLSKFIARENGSDFIVLVPRESDFEKNRIEYIKKEQEIEEILVPNKIEDDNHEENINEFFMTKKLRLTHTIAINIIERYFDSLSKATSTKLIPIWHKINEKNLTKYELTIPCNSTIKSPIKGSFYRDESEAKKSSAFNACIALYKSGDVDDYFSFVDKRGIKSHYWFPYTSEEECQSFACANKLNHEVGIAMPSYLNGTYPQVDNTSYLHILHCVPKYNKLADSSYEPFDKLLKSNQEFGILTSRKLPYVAGFPLFTNFGEICVQIKVNVQTIDFNYLELKRLDEFHGKVFFDVLGRDEFIARDYHNKQNSYLVVPIYLKDNIYNVDWGVVDIENYVETNEPTLEQKESNFFKEYIDVPTIVSPWYRNTTPIQRYLVTEVIPDMTPESNFPTAEFISYEKYYAEKYNISIVNKNQPLINVKSLDVTAINYLVPKLDDRKNKNKFKEILVPELCTWNKFPPVYWIKALMLPTILYRVENLLNTVDLIKTLESKCYINIPYDLHEPGLEIDQFCGFNNSKKKEIILSMCETLNYMENPYEDVINKCISNNWSIEIERQKNVTQLDIINYHAFINNLPDYESNKKKRKNKDGMNNKLQYVIHETNFLNLTTSKAPILSPILKQLSHLNIGPTQSDILKVITTPNARDIFNYTRMQIYGNSFLEFAVSLVLFDALELQRVTYLTETKMNLIGHRNLFNVGTEIDIGSYLLVNAFEPRGYWIPPCFNVPKEIVKLIKSLDLDSNVLHHVQFSDNVKYSGHLLFEDWTDIKTSLGNLKGLISDMRSLKNCSTEYPGYKDYQCDLFMNKQTVNEQIIARCIESLVGTYVKCSGVEVGFKLLCGLGIIPTEYIDSYKTKQNTDDQLNHLNCSKILPGYVVLEERIGYSFKNNDLLIEALTHSSYRYYKSSRFDCYERFGFIGEAILDFLITTYIMEYCNDKTPEEITDIRSFLVNNATFAAFSIRIGLHRFFLYESGKLFGEIDKFFEHQDRIDHEIDNRILYLVEERDCSEPKYMDVPKALSDMFKSFIAAIYLDSGRDLNFVWSMIWKLMGNEIKQFCAKVPKNPIRILHESQLHPTFRISDSANAACKSTEIVMQLNVTLNNKIITVHGCGSNTYKAKLAAAKIALKEIKNAMINLI